MKIDERNRQNLTNHNHSYGEEDFDRLQPSRTSKKTKSYLHKASIVFFGNERLATGVTTTAPTLQALLDAGYKVVAVVSNYEAATSRSSRSLEINEVAKEHAIPFLIPSKPADIIDQLRAYHADIGVLVAYGKIVPQSIIDIFPRGIVNIHPSLLPLYRGPTPLESIILNGEAKTGVSLMKLTRAMDAGPIYAQQQVILTGTEPKQKLSETLLTIGKNMLIDCLPAILDGSLIPTPQDESQATYDQLISKQDGIIDWHKPAKQIEHEIRAFANWPKSRTSFGAKEIIITAATVTDMKGPEGIVTITDKKLVVYCAQQALAIQRLIPAGKQEMAAEAFIAGYRHLL